jgi:4-hydroxybenzoate polyprenyltransferase
VQENRNDMLVPACTSVFGPPMIADALRFIRFSHTVFALPFALGSMLVAAHGLPGWRLVGLILLAMVFARTAAMTFNRLADWEMDKRNPRTAARHKMLPYPAAVAMLAISTAAFVGVTYFINSLCLWLSPVALVIVFFYSLTKRFTNAAQFFLGLALSVAPVGAWLAVTGAFAFAPLVLAFAVLLWVAGFDLIYATQDHDFDKAEGLHSMVVKLGIPGALKLARALHTVAFAGLLAFGYFAGLRTGYAVAAVLICGMLIYEHRSAARLDVAAVNRAFFLSNAIVGALFVVGVAVDVFR